GDRLHFIGGTALSRTHLTSGRLSEDIDLVALGSRTALAAELDTALPRAVARTHGRLEWMPSLTSIADTGAANLRSAQGLSVKIQFISSENRTPWLVESLVIKQRYILALPAELFVLNLPAFVTEETAN